ncbi:hypothetical protein M1K46_21015 [Fictibacillus sp. WQ 8-8]|uniref:hypothetical protein n=1 Tax=Fictibacillus sp. WQ 8-8 TaxID=2938788 RepID=UPI00210D60CC|nr:hypothetical protein [Fictibacillus sp. WQ 8-8]MCQ6268103.1 hypothetical protein [Fictibacillus sp. WQ 8-8]
MVSKLHSCFLLIIAVLSIVLSLFDLYFIKIMLGVSILFMFVILMFCTNGLPRIVYSFFFILSIFLTWIYHIPYSDAVDHLNSNTIFIALFVCIPLLKIPIDQGKYLEEIRNLLTLKNKRSFIYALSAVNFFLSSFLNLGSIRLVDQFKDSRMNENPNKYAAYLNRSFNLAVCWTPYFAAFSVAVSYSKGNPGSVILLGLTLCCIIFLATIMPGLTKLKQQQDLPAYNRTPFNHKIIQLLSFYGLLIGSLLLIEYITPINTIAIICLLSIFYSTSWSLMQGTVKEFLRGLRHFVQRDLPTIRVEALLFISVGFFSHTLIWLNWKVQLPAWSSVSLGYIWLFIFLFIFFVVFIAFFGIHHLVTITLFTASVHWQQLGIQPVIYAMVILISWSLASMISPFSAVNMIISRLVNVKPVRIGLFMNAGYAFGFMLFSTTFLTIINYFIS